MSTLYYFCKVYPMRAMADEVRDLQKKFSCIYRNCFKICLWEYTLQGTIDEYILYLTIKI